MDAGQIAAEAVRFDVLVHGLLRTGRGVGLGQEQLLDMGSKDQREPVLQLAGMRTLPLPGTGKRR